MLREEGERIGGRGKRDRRRGERKGKKEGRWKGEGRRRKIRLDFIRDFNF